MGVFDHGAIQALDERWDGSVAWRQVTNRGDLASEIDAASNQLQDTMADNRQWRSAASSRFPKRIASGSRVTQVTAATAKLSHARYLELARESQRLGDKIEAENYLQHAEHFFRVMRELEAQRPSST